jgi:FkbM family methyltransferase
MTALIWLSSFLPRRVYGAARGLWARTFKRIDVWRRVPQFAPRLGWRDWLAGVKRHAAVKRVAPEMRRLMGRPFLNAGSPMLRAVKAGEIALDCGANIGDIAAELRDTGATVYAFEPNPFAFKVLQQRFDGVPSVHCIQKAVWVSDGKLPLYLHQRAREDQLKWSVGSSLCREKQNVDPNSAIDVEVIDLPRFIVDLRSRVALLKLDVEGAECDILQALIERGVIDLIDRVLIETHEHRVPGLESKLARVRARAMEIAGDRIFFSWR